MTPGGDFHPGTCAPTAWCPLRSCSVMPARALPVHALLPFRAQMAVSFVAVMFLVVVPAASAALAHRSVWAVFIIVVVHEVRHMQRYRSWQRWG